MSDSNGVKTAAERGIALGQVGHRIILENEHVRVWEVRLVPGETIDFHIHYHPYLVISLGGGENEIETIFGQTIPVEESLGSTVFINDMRPGAPADQPLERALSLAADRAQAHHLVGGPAGRQLSN